jgi:hypothetical protein
MAKFSKLFVKYQYPLTRGYHREIVNFTTQCTILMMFPESSCRPEIYFLIFLKIDDRLGVYYILVDNDSEHTEIYI